MYMLSDDEWRSWERTIQRGKEYLQRWQELKDRARRDSSCVPTIARMARELEISIEEAQKRHHYAFNEMAEDELEYIRSRSSGFIDLDGNPLFPDPDFF
jgi:hypothetical protein